MIFIIIALITALVFPCALINAVTSEKKRYMDGSQLHEHCVDDRSNIVFSVSVILKG